MHTKDVQTKIEFSPPLSTLWSSVGALHLLGNSCFDDDEKTEEFVG